MTPADGAATNRGWHNVVTLEHIADSSYGYLKTQLEELAFNLAIAPSWILPCQTNDQTFNLFARFWASALVLAFKCPLAAYQFTMPSQHGLGLENPDDSMQLTSCPIRSLFQPGS